MPLYKGEEEDIKKLGRSVCIGFSVSMISLICNTCYICIFLVAYNVEIVVYIAILWSVSNVSFLFNFVRNRRLVTKKCAKMKECCCCSNASSNPITNNDNKNDNNNNNNNNNDDMTLQPKISSTIAGSLENVSSADNEIDSSPQTGNTPVYAITQSKNINTTPSHHLLSVSSPITDNTNYQSCDIVNEVIQLQNLAISNQSTTPNTPNTTTTPNTPNTKFRQRTSKNIKVAPIQTNLLNDKDRMLLYFYVLSPPITNDHVYTIHKCVCLRLYIE